MKTFRILGLMISYPQPEWLQHVNAFKAVLKEEGLLAGKSLTAVLAFLDRLETGDLFALQEDFVSTFDRGRAHSLHLFEHIHGESRDRGQAMVNLAESYAQKGLFIDQAELPDYLPLFLEFLSCCTPGEAHQLLGEPVEVIAVIGQRLKEKDSPYAVVFDALVALSRVRPQKAWMDQILASSPVDDSLEALDREWEETAAFERPHAADGCGSCAVNQDGLDMKVTG